MVLAGAAMVVTALYIPDAWATPAMGFVSTTLAMGRFDQIDVVNYLVSAQAVQEQLSNRWLPPQTANQTAGEQHGSNLWLSLQKTKGPSDLYVQSNVWQPGGSSGWHTHPGHSLITVIEGAVTVYEGNDPECKPRVYTRGMGFVDPGDGHVHNLRNEGDVEARTITVQLLPAGAERRIDAPDPGSCRF